MTLILLLALQEGTLDLLDGETLYEEGWLLTTGFEQDRREGLLHGRDRRSDPFDRTIEEKTLSLGAHYGVRYDVQVSAIFPVVERELRLDDPAGPDRFISRGAGDLALAAKWRFLRLDGEGRATNFALIGGLELPTGPDDRRDHGSRLPPDLQPGSGTWDPSIGAAVTHEPGRWRFNAATLYQRRGQGDHDFKEGDELFAELAAGHRYWLVPYPGPFSRFDVMLRYRHRWRSFEDGDIVHDSGGDLLTLGANLAFRTFGEPFESGTRPSYDFQLAVEVPVYEKVMGFQLEEDASIFFVFGYRI